VVRPKRQRVRITYTPPPREVIDKYARTVCAELGKNVRADFNKPQVVRGFAEFMHVVASISAKYYTEHPESLDNTEQKG
jgi:hypothetical protein